MGVLRDVLARFTVLVDDAPLSETDKKIEKIKKGLRSAATVAAASFAIIGAGAFALTQEASGAEEAVSGLVAVLGEVDANNIIKWSKDVEKAFGRSQFATQEAAFGFAAFLDPIMEGADADIAKMSADLTKLSYELASFYNTSEEEAIMRLKSGLAGETESVRRLGIDISDIALNKANEAKGDRRTTQALSRAEKAQLVYEKIFHDSTNAQGDLVRSAGRWADTLKRVEGRMKTFRVTLGKTVKDYALPLLNTFQKMVEVVDIVVNKTHALETAWRMLQAAAAVYLTRQALINIAIMAMAGELEAAAVAMGVLAVEATTIAAAFLVLEDIIGFFRGSQSAIGDTLTALSGVERPLDIVLLMWRRIEIAIHNATERLKEFVGFGLYTAKLRNLDTEILLETAGHDAEFQKLVAAGDADSMSKAATYHHRPGENFDSAKERAYQTRTRLLKEGKAMPTEDDFAENLITREEAAKIPYALTLGHGTGAPPSLPDPTQPDPLRAQPKAPSLPKPSAPRGPAPAFPFTSAAGGQPMVIEQNFYGRTEPEAVKSAAEEGWRAYGEETDRRNAAELSEYGYSGGEEEE